MAFLLVSVALLPAGCRGRDAKEAPRIEITTVPPSDRGGPDLMDTIAGRVVGAQPGQRVVVFSKSRLWWVQPGARHPFTEVKADSTWTTPTHLGTDYAALLVDPSYHPPASSEGVPEAGAGVVARVVVEGDRTKRVNRPIVSFSGYEWLARAAPSERGGENDYDPANAFTDAQGALHLRIAGRAPSWTCAEVSLTRRLGYGVYRFVVRDAARLEPSAVLSFFTWDGPAADANHREMDVEISRWGNPAEMNGQFVVQPYYVPANVARFNVPAGVVTYTLRWEPGRATFRAVRGAGTDAAAPAVAGHVFTSGVPAPGDEQVRMNLYVFRRGTKALEAAQEVVIESFEYTP